MLNRKALVVAGCWSVALWSAVVTAQVPVVEAGVRRGQPAAAAAAAPAAESNDLVLTLYNQLESLQQEIQNLRGLVEEQANQIRRMQTENRDRYLDVDRRLSELSGAAGATAALPLAGGLPAANAGAATLPPAGATPDPQQPLNSAQGSNNTAPPLAFGNAPAAGAPATPGGQAPAPQTFGGQPTAASPQVATGGAVQNAPAAGQGIGAELNEQDLYRNALNILLEQQPARYEESIAMFQNYILRFPQGRLLTNAYYWLGEALILVERFPEARDTFSVLISSYPDDPKAAGALLKRGDVYQRMGQRDLAEQDWSAIATRYPENATEIREADTRLRRR